MSYAELEPSCVNMRNKRRIDTPRTLSSRRAEWTLMLSLLMSYPLGLERLSQSSKRVGPMRGLSPGVRL